MSGTLRARDCLLGATCLIAAVATGAAQELEPKAYSASPVGAVFVTAGFARSTGAIVFDPTVPITDADATFDAAIAAGGYTFGLFGKLALVSAIVPYSWGEASGLVGGDARSTTRSGLADARFRFSINLLGNQAMRTREFAKTPRRPILGTSLVVAAPTGQYYGNKLINVGANRWAFKPEVGLAMPKGRWDFDLYLGVWLFTANPDFYPGGQERTQEPVVALQGHVSYTFRPRLWAAFDATWYQGGKARVEDGALSKGLSNSRAGATVSLPVGRRNSFKVSYSSGVSVRTGENFQSFSVAFQWLKFTKM